jgi:uncharacterized small protein (DUF1192 family)
LLTQYGTEWDCRAFGETLSTLQFGSRAKLIKNMASRNEGVIGGVTELQKEIARLRAEVERLRVHGKSRTTNCAGAQPVTETGQPGCRCSPRQLERGVHYPGGGVLAEH